MESLERKMTLKNLKIVIVVEFEFKVGIDDGKMQVTVVSTPDPILFVYPQYCLYWEQASHGRKDMFFDEGSSCDLRLNQQKEALF